MTDPRLNLLSQELNGLGQSSCGLCGPRRPVALSPSDSLLATDIIVSAVAVLKSPFVDVEDFDRVVGTGTSKLDPGALLFEFSVCVTQPIHLAVL